MELWVVFTIAAAATQALRTAVQRRMTAKLGNLGASYIRFSYANAPEYTRNAIQRLDEALSSLVD